jgi:membrane complex biogenesis BtpA family protein
LKEKKVSTILNNIFGDVKKPVIGMVHIHPLPGSYNYNADAGLDGIVEAAAMDIETYQEVGFDGLLFCNEADMPFSVGVEHITPAAMVAVISELKSVMKIPFGTDVIMDNKAAISVAAVTGGRFVRGIFTNAYISEMGILDTDGAGDIMYKKHIGADNVAIFARISQGLASPIVERSLKLLTYGAIWSALADAVVVTGLAPGDTVSVDALAEAKQAAGDIPIVASNGIDYDNVGSIMGQADAVIIGTRLKVDQVTLKPVVKEKAQRFMDAVAKARK